VVCVLLNALSYFLQTFRVSIIGSDLSPYIGTLVVLYFRHLPNAELMQGPCWSVYPMMLLGTIFVPLWKVSVTQVQPQSDES